MTRILFFDVDGTIYVPGEPGIRPAVLKAIHQAQAQGIRCYIASGRPYSALSHFLLEAGFDGFVLSNGAQLKMGETSRMSFLPQDEVRRGCRFLRQQGIHYALQTDETICVPEEWQDMTDYYAHFCIGEDRLTRHFEEEDQFCRTLKVEFVTHTEEQREAVRAWQTTIGKEMHPDGFSMELNDTTCSKADGVLEVLTALGMDPADSIGFGDAVNDIPMLKVCGTGVAMGNASDEVKSAADEVCGSVFEDGVAVYLTDRKLISPAE